MLGMIHRPDNPATDQMTIKKIRKWLVSCTTFAERGPSCRVSVPWGRGEGELDTRGGRRRIRLTLPPGDNHSDRWQ